MVDTSGPFQRTWINRTVLIRSDACIRRKYRPGTTRVPSSFMPSHAIVCCPADLHPSASARTNRPFTSYTCKVTGPAVPLSSVTAVRSRNGDGPLPITRASRAPSLLDHVDAAQGNVRQHDVAQDVELDGNRGPVAERRHDGQAVVVGGQHVGEQELAVLHRGGIADQVAGRVEQVDGNSEERPQFAGAIGENVAADRAASGEALI